MVVLDLVGVDIVRCLILGLGINIRDSGVPPSSSKSSNNDV